MKQLYYYCAVLACISGLSGQVHAGDAKALPGSKISLAPLPVNIYMQPNMKPTVAFSTPCMQIEKLTNGFPPFVAFEHFMFEMIGKINESDILPVKIEPVCT